MASSRYSPQLSKSRFIAGLQCLKRIYLECYERNLADPIDAQQQAIFDTGTGVGELARGIYPHGRLIEEQYFEHAQAVKTTEIVLRDPNVPAVFEGAFSFEKIRIRADILKRNGDGTFDLIEVKSTTSAKPQHTPDVAIQLYVLESLGVSIRTAYLMHIDNRYVYQGGLHDVEAMFSMKDVTRESREFLSTTAPNKLVQMWEALDSDTVPAIEIGPHCTSPYRCPFYGHCHQQVTHHPVTDLPGASREFLSGLKKSGIEDIRSIPTDYPGLSTLQKQVRECVLYDRAFVGQNLRTKLREISFPVSFLDFETHNPALPAYVGTSPYQSVPFQWSLHIKSESGDIVHRSFIWTEGDDPRPALVESLIDAIPPRGAIVTYSNYEQRVMRDLAKEFPGFKDVLLDLCDRTFDLLKLVREEYYHPQFHGSFSIKSVFPVLVPDMGYEGLEIQHGLVAAIDFAKMVTASTPTDEKEKIKQALLAYCEKDTEAMVRVFEALSSIGK
jgi:hypothetical protein